MAQLLLEFGVSPCVSASDGTTALMKARHEIVGHGWQMVEAAQQCLAACEACMGSHREVAAELILRGANVPCFGICGTEQREQREDESEVLSWLPVRWRRP